MPSALSKPAKYRDGRLDVLRGLCLLNMVLVHLYDQGMTGPAWVHELIVHWFRFAAGGFIMTSGMCIGAIHYQRALDPAKRTSTHRSLFQRAGLVLLVHYFSAFLSLLIIPLRGDPVHDVWKMTADVLLFYSGYELLLFYVVMLLAAPLMIEIIRRFGPVTMLAVSGAIFCIKYQNPYLSWYAIENHFPLLRWQLVFVVGVVGGSLLPKFDVLSASIKWKLLAGSAATAMLVAGYAAIVQANNLAVPAWIGVSKYPLSILEVLRYATLTFAIGVLVDRVYPAVAGSIGERCLAAIGAQSLLLWVVHNYVTAQVVHLQWLLAVGLAFVAMWLIARFGSVIGKWWQDHAPILPRLGYVTPMVGSLVAIMILRSAETTPDFALTPPPPSPAMETNTFENNDLVLVNEITPDEQPETSDLSPVPLDDNPFDNAT